MSDRWYPEEPDLPEQVDDGRGDEDPPPAEPSGDEDPPPGELTEDDPFPGGGAPEGNDLVEAARSLDPAADALPDDLDPLTGTTGPTGGSIHDAPVPRDRDRSVPALGEEALLPGGEEHGRPAEVPPRADEAGPDALAEAPQRYEHDVLRPGGGPPVRRPARVIAVANQKGGVGKTTSVINLGAALAELGNRVLLVDMDPQGSLGVGIGADPHTLSLSVYNLLMNDGTTPDDVILQTRFDDLHLLPSNIDLAAAEIMLVQEVAREQSLRRVLDRLRYRYDFILVDCPPSLGLLTINGLTAADGVIVPLECEYFALRGMTLLMNTIRKVQERLNPELEIKGILATMVDTRTIHAREVLERVHEAFGSVVFKSTINKTIRFAEAPVAGEPILTYAAENRGADAYRELAREVLSRESTS